MNDHPPTEGNCDVDGGAAVAPAEVDHAPSQATPAGLPEPDFSLLRMAIERLDGAFRQR